MNKIITRVKKCRINRRSALKLASLSFIFLFTFKYTYSESFKEVSYRTEFIKLREKIKISGRVTDDEGQKFPGVIIKIKNKEGGTQTDINGYFELQAEKGDILVFSFLGMTTQSIVVGNKNVIDVVLLPNVSELDEVIVVGYGTQRKSDLTGSISSIKAEEISNAGTISIDQALAGKASGVQVTQNSGVLGGGATIKIRGVSSMTGSSPLYVIDGVLLDNSSMSSINVEQEASSNISPLSTINAEDIKSIEILKDASATAIYGSRGANGVILITTKTGKSGKGIVNFSSDFGISNNPTQIKLQDANQYWLTRNEASVNGGVPLTSNDLLNIDSANKGLLSNTNWQDAIFQQGLAQTYNLDFSGGNDDVRYRFSTNYYDATGTILNTNFNRASSRLNLDAKLNNTINIGTRLYYAIINSDQVNSSTNDNLLTGNNSAIKRALASIPTTDINSDDVNNPLEFDGYSPLTAIKGNKYDNYLAQFVGNLFINVNILKNLKFKTDLSYQGRGSNQRYYQFNILPPAFSKRGWARTNDGKVSLLTNTNTLDYNFVKKDHKFTAVLGQSMEFFSNSAVISSNYGFANDYLLYYAPQTAAFNDPDIYNFASTRLISFFTRLNYTYKNKLLLTLTGRADGSSKFAKNNKFGFFPAVALGYKLSEENFLKESKSISNLKLRLSYGISGNQSIQPYQSLDQLASFKYGFGNGSGGEVLNPIYYPSQLPNPNLKWEETEQLNAGFDFGLLNERYTATFDYYIKNTNDLLVVGNRIPSHSGFTTYTENLGQLQTKGADLGLSAQIFDAKKFSWNLSTIMSVGKTKIKDMGANYIESGYNQGWVAGGTQRLIIGQELGAFFGYQTSGIAQFDDFVEFQNLTNEQRITLYNLNPKAVFTPLKDAKGVGVIALRPGEQLYQDLDGNGLINEFDRQVIGLAQPNFTLGLSNTFKFNKFELNVNVDGQFGQKIANVANFSLLGFHGNQQLALVRERWTPENPSNTYPRLSTLNFGAPAFKMSDRFLEDGSFWRIQNITLGYQLPRSLISKIKAKSAKIYVSGSNLLVVSDYSGYNPDVSLNGSNNLSMGHDNAGFPVARTFRVGVNIQF
jgi:TonB-linked SusC/RagA family outer membrane protein